MEWIKDFSRQTSRQTKILLIGGATGVAVTCLACAYYYKYRKSKNMENLPVAESKEPLGANSDIILSFEALNSESESMNQTWVTPTASNEKLVCRVVNGEEQMDDESPRLPFDRKKQPVEMEFEIDNYEHKKPCRKILILGLDGSGKSALLSQLSKEGKDCVEYDPTEGFNIVCITFENLDLNIWEIGGSEEYRTYWKKFSGSTSLILFTVDSTDTNRFSEAKHYLNEIISELDDEQIDFNIIATKSDKKGSVTTQEIQTALGLDGMKINILKVAVKTGGAEENVGVDEVQKCCLYDTDE